nr:MAG TPA: hypothetical protein [Caudoviricetes sp.]
MSLKFLNRAGNFHFLIFESKPNLFVFQIFETKLILFEIGIFQTKLTFRIEFLKRDPYTPINIGIQISQTNQIFISDWNFSN